MSFLYGVPKSRFHTVKYNASWNVREKVNQYKQAKKKKKKQQQFLHSNPMFSP